MRRAQNITDCSNKSTNDGLSSFAFCKNLEPSLTADCSKGNNKLMGLSQQHQQWNELICFIKELKVLLAA
jgi:hypothetical protein